MLIPPLVLFRMGTYETSGERSADTPLIFVVEDGTDIARLICHHLNTAGYATVKSRKRNARRVKALALPAVSRLAPQKALAPVQNGALSWSGKLPQDSNVEALAYD